MSLIWFLSGTVALVLLFTLYRATLNGTRDDRMVRAANRSGHEGVEELPENSNSNSRNRLRAVNSTDFVESHDFPQDFIFFDIRSDTKTSDSTWHGGSPISFDQFKDSIPYIPLESKIVVRQIGGADAHFLKRIAALRTKREILLLLDDSADLPTGTRHERGSR